ncbi:heterokaryon incompatibility protein (HET) domain-containing protein [Purpureocillium lavendulum]|uniref:Heterokaryon incompatibility protein (HET) domain-containing protein n=1 Tax=Purpureocillium lavendulum TaxID=1247861 RepID=A0AB34FHT3_9HYPO|nr:heterokaryon incompatibility protein (HET) domain-containing protein [Purpureocillium lavendulum]
MALRVSPLSNSKYRVGWIAALPVEMAAALSALESNHGKPRAQHEKDHNSYTLGHIGRHNIVVACLPAGGYGTINAAHVASQMVMSFPQLRFGLLVGVGGGIPSAQNDIRLGDVVISKPEGILSGVVQYDFGKVREGDIFVRTGNLAKPPPVVLNGIASLQTQYELGKGRITECLRTLYQDTDGGDKLTNEFEYPGAANDKLFNAKYVHPEDQATCDSCHPGAEVVREPRINSEPVIHYGTIASGNRVVKSAEERDREGKLLGALCFEMEAAGIMDNFPCLVIRGVCDYSDSHKNKRWQRYSAATAAAYAVEFLGHITPEDVRETPAVTEATAVGAYGEDIRQATSGAHPLMASRGSLESANEHVFSSGDTVLARRSQVPIDTLVTAHGILMTLVFVAGYPIGAIISRFIHQWFIHAGWQLLVYCGMWAGFGVGIVASSRFDLFFTSPHTRLGVFVVPLLGIQPLLGLLHHLYFLRNRQRGIISYIHIWYGRSLMIIGVVNGGLGIKYARDLGLVRPAESHQLQVGYIVVASIVAAAYIGSIAFTFIMDTREPFTYTPLSSDDSIRVVEILPGDFEDAIECEIFATTSGSQSSYEALSLHITVNLERALRYLRRRDSKRPLWIDAICINQQDYREKERQVRAIATIFKQSTQVLVWLGEELDPSIQENGPPLMPISEVFEVISAISEKKSVAEFVGNNPWERWTPSLLNFLKRPWFKRLWVVQETAMTWNPLLVWFTSNGAVAIANAFENIDALLNAWTWHQLWKHDKDLSAQELARRLIRLLFQFKGKFLCSDERDRLYGILGIICAPESSAPTPIDYEKDAAAVFKELAVFLIESRNSLDILFGDRATFDSSGYPGKPSWVPTWKSYTTFTRGFYPPPPIWTEGEPLEGFEPKQPRAADYRFSDDQQVLFVKGCAVGDVIGIGTPPSYYPDDGEGKSTGEESRNALSQLLMMWETELVYLPTLRVKATEEEFNSAVDEYSKSFTPEFSHLPSWRARWATEQDSIDAFRKTLFRREDPGSRNSRVTWRQCYEMLLGREECHGEHEEEVREELGRFAYFKWRDIHGMIPFRLSGGQFGIVEFDMDVYSGDGIGHEFFVVLIPGGPGPVAVRAEKGGLRFISSCYVQGLEDETAWEAFLEGKELFEFPLI